MTIEITRKDMTAQELRRGSSKSKDAKAARRMLAIALVLEGVVTSRWDCNPQSGRSH